VILTIVFILFARNKFVSKNYVPSTDDSKLTFIPKLLTNKYYVDEFYNTIIVKPLNGLASFTYKILELKGINLLVDSVGKLVVFTSSVVRKVQSGNTGFYILAMVVSIVVILIINLFNK
jgi:NADH-quinone oxidoreductase subunit L